MKFLEIFLVIGGVLAGASEKNEERNLKKRNIYGDGFPTGLALDTGSAGSVNGDVNLGNSGLFTGFYGGAFGFGSGGNFGASLPPFNGGGNGLISRHVTVQNNVAVPIPQPYPVTLTRTVAVPFPQPVRIPIDRPYPVRVPQPVPVPYDRPFPVTVERPYPVPVPHPVPVRVPRPVPYPVPRPIPVPVNSSPPQIPQQMQNPAFQGSPFVNYGFSGSGGAGPFGPSFPTISSNQGSFPTYNGLYPGRLVNLGPQNW